MDDRPLDLPALDRRAMRSAGRPDAGRGEQQPAFDRRVAEIRRSLSPDGD